MVWDVTAGLPDDGTPVERIYAGHVLEHLPHAELPAILARWAANPAVHPGTVLAVVGPDCDEGARWVADGRMTPQEYADIDVTRDGGYHEGSPHLWRSTPAATAAALVSGGWAPRPATPSALAADGWPVTSLVAWQFAILAYPTGAPHG